MITAIVIMGFLVVTVICAHLRIDKLNSRLNELEKKSNDNRDIQNPNQSVGS